MRAPEEYFAIEPSVSNHFAWIRTQLALQSTLMAAVRTSVSLIGFGFTVAQFFQRLVDDAPAEIQAIRAQVPRNLGLVLIAAGVISLAVFTWQYHRANAYMRSGGLEPLAGSFKRPLRTSSYSIAFVVMLIGLAAFVSVFFRF
jgi:putative membrane protein